jgi:aminopeptidase N
VLDGFFEQWIHRGGHPVLEVSHGWDRGAVQLKVVQKQTDLYALPVPVGITTASGKRVHPVWIRQREETFSLPSAEKPLLIHFDEGDALLAEVTFPKAKDELLYQLEHDNAIGRMEAAAALQPLAADPAVAEALKKAATYDSFWAVRRDALPASDVALLRARAAEDPSSGVRVAALAALGRLRDASLSGFFEQRFRQDDSYLAQAEAVRALGRLGGSRELLRQAAAMKSHNDVIARAAREALER